MVEPIDRSCYLGTRCHCWSR